MKKPDEMTKNELIAEIKNATWTYKQD